MAEMEELVAKAIGCNAKALSSYTHFKGEHERNTRLFPVDLRSRTGQGLWIKLTNWQADADGFVDRDSKRQGRITPRLHRSSNMLKGNYIFNLKYDALTKIGIESNISVLTFTSPLVGSPAE